MELTERGWEPAKKFTNCEAEIRKCLKDYNRDALNAVADISSLFSAWIIDIENEEDYTKLVESGQVNPMTAMYIYMDMYRGMAEKLIDEINDDEYQEQIRDCLIRHNDKGIIRPDDECEQCTCPDCYISCELMSKSANRQEEV